MTSPNGENDAEKAVKGLMEAEAAARSGLPPVESWSPEREHAIDMRIVRDGTWLYMGSPIARQRLVKLFASILMREADGSFHLVTPVEKARIEVEDAPFIAVAMEAAGEGDAQTLAFTTALGDVAVAGPDHPLRIEADPETGEPAPYVHIRGARGGGLEARLSRPVYYDLVARGQVHELDGEAWFGVWSGGAFFRMQRAEALEGARP